MISEQPSTRKTVAIDQIKPGMYVVGLDRSWLQTPFFTHRKLIKNVDDIELLKRSGIRQIVIDTALGVDVGDPEPGAVPTSEPAPEPTPAPEQVAAPDTPAEPAPAQVARPQKFSSAEKELQQIGKELDAAGSLQAEAMAVAQSIFDGAKSGAPIDSKVAEQVVRDLLSSVERSPEANLLLIQMRRFHNDLFSHAVNVCVLAMVFVASEHLTDDAKAIGMGALLHDIGETRIPRNLIRKLNEELSDTERQLMQQHPKLGASIILQSADMPEIARRIVLEHHERIDGSGYPRRIFGAEISLMSQIVGIIDAYDDMFSGRNGAVLQPIEVLRQLFLLSNAGAFDRGLVERIIRCLGVYPVGSVVEFNTGERGIVVAVNRADSLKPTVRIITSPTGMAYLNGPILSLGDDSQGRVGRRIIAVLDPGKERIDPMVFLRLVPGAPV